MTEPRLKSEFRISAHLRRAQAAGAFATIIKRGDADAGAIFVKVFLGGGSVAGSGDSARLYAQTRDLDGHLIWHEPLKGVVADRDVDAWLEKERRIDPDFWVIEIEDGDGRAFLED